MTLKHRSMFFLGQIKYHGITAFDCVLTERQLTVIFLSTPENEWMIHIRIMFGWWCSCSPGNSFNKTFSLYCYVMKNCFPLSSRSLLYNEVDEDGSVNLIAELVKGWCRLWHNEHSTAPFLQVILHQYVVSACSLCHYTLIQIFKYL